MTERLYPPAHSPSPLPDLVVRHAVQSDLPAMEWGGEFSHFRRLYADIFASTQQGRTLMWIADLAPVGVIGQLFVQLNSARPELADGAYRGYIYGFRIQARYRSQGIGTYMMDIAEADLYQRGYHWVTLNVGKDNPRARELYEGLGYHVVAEEPGIWSYIDQFGRRQDVHEPAWRMEKRLQSPLGAGR